MSFKNKMKNRGISKLDNLVETPDYITSPTPKKTSWNWLKIAIPVTAGLALVIIPVSILGATGAFSARNSSKSDMAPGNNSSSDPEYNWGGDDSHSPSEPHWDPIEDGEQVPGGHQDYSFGKILERNYINDNYFIEVYDYADGYTEPTYIFEGEEAINIINSIKEVKSEYSSFMGLYGSKDSKKNSSGHFMGINHRLKFTDGYHFIIAEYYSQFATLTHDLSAFNIADSDAYTIMDAHIEMDYDPTFDETIN